MVEIASGKQPQFAMENGHGNGHLAIEIVDVPIEVVVMFYSYVSHYQRVCWELLG